MGSVAVAIPWRDRGIPLRRKHRATIGDWFARNLPEARVFDCDSDSDDWSLAAARNAGVEQAGTDVVVVCDADNHPEVDPLRAAIDACQTTGLVHLPYTEFRNGSFRWSGSVGGIYVATPDAWWRSGGQDPRFTGWGCEDHAHVMAHGVLLGEPMPRHAGVLTHLPHPAPPERDPHHIEHQAAAHLLARYRRAGDPVTMAELVGEWR